MSEANATFVELCDAAAGLPRTVDRALWGQQGYLVGNFMYARFGVDAKGAFALLKLPLDVQGQALGAHSGFVAKAPYAWLAQTGWVLAHPRSAAEVETTKGLVATAHARFAGDGH